MTQTAWAHLPNAKHIDWVLASLKANPEKWNAAYYTAWTAARAAAWYEARNAARFEAFDAAWYAACDAAYDMARTKAYDASRGAILALIVYDDCGYMIESEIGELKIIAAFGDTRAILLLPACNVYNELTKTSIAV